MNFFFFNNYFKVINFLILDHFNPVFLVILFVLKLAHVFFIENLVLTITVEGGETISTIQFRKGLWD